MRILATAVAALLAVSPMRADAQRIVINEIMADPTKVTDANGEWVELLNTTSAAISLLNWKIKSNGDADFTIASAVSVPANGYVVFARNASSSTNGGVTGAIAYSGLNFANASDYIEIVDATGASVDKVSWTGTTAGKSWSLKNPFVAHANAIVSSVWQMATSTYGLGDFGTPGARNDGYTGTPPASELIVRVLDVGQGDAVYIANGTSKVIIDGGPSTARFGFLLDSLGLNGSTINAVILSHAHTDHLTGLQELFRTTRHITINSFFENKDASSLVGLAKLRDSINRRVVAGTLIYRDTDDPCSTGAATCTVTLSGGAKLIVMKPKPTDGNPNNRSVAVKLIGPDPASFSMWFAGDAERNDITYLMTNYGTTPGLASKVLKLDHHGSCNGITSAYLAAINPDRVVASVANSNTFKHMHKQTKDLLTTKSKRWYRTDQNGTVVYKAPASGAYTTTVLRGTTNMSGASDAVSTSSECNPIP